jgi:hypothetical protein
VYNPNLLRCGWRTNFIFHIQTVVNDSSLISGRCCSLQEFMHVLIKEHLQAPFTIQPCVEQDACVSSPNLQGLATNFHVPFWCGERLQPYVGPLLQLAGAHACINEGALAGALHYSTMRGAGRTYVYRHPICRGWRSMFMSHFGVVNDSSLISGHCCSLQGLMHVLMKEHLQAPFTIQPCVEQDARV